MRYAAGRRLSALLRRRRSGRLGAAADTGRPDEPPAHWAARVLAGAPHLLEPGEPERLPRLPSPRAEATAGWHPGAPASPAEPVPRPVILNPPPSPPRPALPAAAWPPAVSAPTASPALPSWRAAEGGPERTPPPTPRPIVVAVVRPLPRPGPAAVAGAAVPALLAVQAVQAVPAVPAVPPTLHAGRAARPAPTGTRAASRWAPPARPTDGTGAEPWPVDVDADAWPSLLDEPRPDPGRLDLDEQCRTADLRREHESRA